MCQSVETGQHTCAHGLTGIVGRYVPVKHVQQLNLCLAYGLLHFLCDLMKCQLRLWHGNGAKDHTQV